MRNYNSHSFLLAISTIVILLLLSLLPNTGSGFFSLRHISITEDVAPTRDLLATILNSRSTKKASSTPKTPIQQTALLDTTSVTIVIPKTTIPPKKKVIKKDTIKKKKRYVTAPYKKIDSLNISTNDSTALTIKPIHIKHATDLIPIENSNNPEFRAFLAQLRSQAKTRIAITGDSYIEGDILAQDIRANLQLKYGGNGVGFMPISSPITGFRRSVKHSFDGWSNIDVLKKSRTNYYLNGYIFYPTEGAWVKYSGVNYRPHLDKFTQAKLMFINTGKTIIRATVNQKYDTVITPPTSADLQVITIKDTMQNIRFSFKNVNGFSAYGAILDDYNGVSVDNHSVRSYSGIGLLNLRAKIMTTAQKSHKVDLVILQYGLNAVNLGTSKYSAQLYRIINHIKALMPGTAILVMSIGDSEHRVAGKWKTKPAILQMEAMQRAVAMQCNVAFWSTLQAAGKHGGIHQFVENGWAAKDYLHLSPKGGKVLATMLTDAIRQSAIQ